MARSSAAPLVLALAQSASADIVLSRTVNSLSAGSIKVTLDGGACASSDAYGSNQCDLDWGKSCGPTALAPILPCARGHSERHDHSARPHSAMRLGPLRRMCVARPRRRVRKRHAQQGHRVWRHLLRLNQGGLSIQARLHLPAVRRRVLVRSASHQAEGAHRGAEFHHRLSPCP